MLTCKITHQPDLCRFDVATASRPLFLRVAKREQNVMDIPLPPEGSSLHYDDLALGTTPLCGTFDLYLESREPGDLRILDHLHVHIDPPVPPATWHDCGGILGTNYTSASSASQIEFWSRFDQLTDEIAAELVAAADIGINTLRVFLHDRVFRDDNAFHDKMERFAGMCAGQGIRPLYVFFDDCWYGDEQTVLDFTPIAGSHNGRWAKSPLLADRRVEQYPTFERYIKDTITRFREDSRIFGWEIWNEPKNTGMPGCIDTEFTEDLMSCGFLWARQAAPSQPVVSCWDGNRFGDIDNQHNYAHNGIWEYPEGVGCALDERRGTIVTEGGSRTWGGEGYGSPVHWLSWLEERRSRGLRNPGVFLNWELMAGNSNCAWHWSSHPGDERPAVPWCGFFLPDRTPVSIAEVAAMRRYAGLEAHILHLYGFDREDALAGLPAAQGFSLYCDGRLGELRHEAKTTDEAAFPSEIPAGWNVQVLLRLEEAGAAAGIRAKGTGTAVTAEMTEAGLTMQWGELTVQAGHHVALGVLHNLKLSMSPEGELQVYLDDLGTPLVLVKSETATLWSFSLIARGRAAFDDFAVIQ